MLDHPAAQSLLLPALLSLAAMALLRALGRPWSGTAVWIGLLGAWSLVPGWTWPAAALPALAPWTLLVLGLVGAGWRARTPTPAADPAAPARAAALGAGLLGLAVLAGLGGSLLLAQMALAVAAALGTLALWAWVAPGAGVAFAPADLLVPWGAALLLALAATDGTALRLGLLAWVAAVAWAVPRLGWARRHPRWLPWGVVLLVAMGIGVALGVQMQATAPAPDADDPYFTPRWD